MLNCVEHFGFFPTLVHFLSDWKIDLNDFLPCCIAYIPTFHIGFFVQNTFLKFLLQTSVFNNEIYMFDLIFFGRTSYSSLMHSTQFQKWAVDLLILWSNTNWLWKKCIKLSEWVTKAIFELVNRKFFVHLKGYLCAFQMQVI